MVDTSSFTIDASAPDKFRPIFPANDKADRRLMLRKVLVPQLFIFSSLRIALSLSRKIALVAEAFGAGSGIGQQLITWFQDTRVDMMLAWGVSFMIVMALIDLLLFRLWARRSFAWRQQFAT